MIVKLLPHQKIYFASDFHLGAPTLSDSHTRERRLIAWLNTIKTDARLICLVGDLFDFWYEYRRVVPKGFVRILGKLAELSDSGVEILFFPGNHDMWMTNYFEQELHIQTYRKPLKLIVKKEISDSSLLPPDSSLLPPDSSLLPPDSSLLTPHSFYITHGDGLGPGDYAYKFLKQVFESKLSKWAFGNLLHPDWGLWLAHQWAKDSWQKHEKEGKPTFLGEDKEWLLQYAKEVEQQSHHDFYIFGHRHIELDMSIATNSRILILGDWISYNTYAEFDGESMQLKRFTP